MGPRLVNLGEKELATSSRILRNELGAVGEGVGERAAQGVGGSARVETTSGQKLLEQKATGRIAPSDVREKLAMEEAMAKPAGKHLKNIEMQDPRYPAADGWIKMEQKVGTNPADKVVIHYLKNKKTGAVADFKYK